MKKSFLVAFITALLVSTAMTYILSTDGARKILHPVAEKTVSGIDKAEIENVVGAFLLYNPEIILQSLEKLREKQENENKEKRKAALVVGKSVLDDERYPVLGKGKYPIYHFYDYNCGYCKMFSKVIFELAEKNKDIRIIMHDTPIFGDDSIYAAKVGLFANSKGKYKEYYGKMMQLKGKANEESASRIIKEIGLSVVEMKKFIKDNKTIDELLDKTKDLAIEVDISSMPTTVIDDELYLGASEYSKMKEIVDKYVASEKEGSKK